MKLVNLVTIDRLDRLIRHKATGTPTELASRLEMSRSSLFELIAFLKDEMKAPITYIGSRPSYVYTYTPKFYLGFEQDHLADEKMNNVHGEGNEKENGKQKIEIEIDDDEYILDDDIDFNNLYH